MIKKLVVYLTAWLVALSFNQVITAQGQKDGKESEMPVVVFVCEHGSAKSIVAVAYFNRLAEEQHLKVRAIARGTTPDKEIAPTVVKGLQAEGLKPSEAAPKKISQADLAGAQRVIAFCQLPDDYPGRVRVEHWDDMPPVSEDYGKARDQILERIGRLLDELKSGK